VSQPTPWTIEFYQDARGRSPVEEWVDTLPDKDHARIRRGFDMLERFGVQLVMPHARHLRGKLFELRVAVGRRDYRVLYFAVAGRRLILLHGFAKSTPKTPARELAIAEQRLAEFEDRLRGV
jgi:phage-related protein